MNLYFRALKYVKPYILRGICAAICTAIQLHILGIPVDRLLLKCPAFHLTHFLSQLQIKSGLRTPPR